MTTRDSTRSKDISKHEPFAKEHTWPYTTELSSHEIVSRASSILCVNIVPNILRDQYNIQGYTVVESSITSVYKYTESVSAYDTYPIKRD